MCAPKSVNIGNIEAAWKVFGVLPQRGIDAWNAMMIAYSRHEYPDEVLNLYSQMIFEGVRPDNDNLTFTVALKECSRLFDLKTIEKLWCKAMDCGFEFEAYVGSSVLNIYAKYQKMDEAIVVFDSMLGRDLVCWTTTISGFAKMQKEAMDGDGIVMVGFTQNGIVSLVSALLACSQVGFWKLSKSIHKYIVRRLNFDRILGTAVFDMYSKFGALSWAYTFFDQTNFQDSISSNTMITSYKIHGYGKGALSQTTIQRWGEVGKYQCRV
ncbi:hypothetical protein ACB098_12G175300 [Castanea mollissima]